MLAGSIPSFCAGGVTNVTGLYVIRFFIGILGGSFVPCQVWTTAFFDKNVIGTANSLTAGFGNSGGGITYFVMPAIYESLVRNQHLKPDTSWRVAFVVPSIIIVFIAITMLLFCPDTPTGPWAEREMAVEQNMRRHSMIGVVNIPGALSVEKPAMEMNQDSKDTSPSRNSDKKDVIPPTGNIQYGDHEAHITPEQMMDTAQGEVVRKPSFGEAMKVFASPSTFTTMACYFCSFGAELAINSILGAYYVLNFKNLSLQKSGDWAAMFGLLNVVFRPIGGAVSDLLYKYTGSLWAKKAWLHTCALMSGVFLILIGKLNPHGFGTAKSHTAFDNHSEMFGLVAGLAFFIEAGNGANYSLVPHVHPYANGIISGFTGAAGNLGGIVFAIIFRFTTKGQGKLQTNNYSKAIWIIGVITICVNVAVMWIRPIPKGQVGGHGR